MATISGKDKYVQDPSEMLCSNATILRVRSDPGWDIAHVMQRSEDTKKLDASYFTMPPEALIFRKMGANVFMDAGELAELNGFGNNGRKNSFCPQKKRSES